MTLNELKNYIKSVCLKHQDIKEFYIGSSYNEAEDMNLSYPLVFFELPYYINYNLNPRKNVDNVQFGFNVFVDSNWDKVDDDHDAISVAKTIGDEIVTYILEDTRNFIINGITAVSVREFGNDSVAGIRFEWNVTMPREVCLDTYIKKFN